MPPNMFIHFILKTLMFEKKTLTTYEEIIHKSKKMSKFVRIKMKYMKNALTEIQI